VKITMNDVHEMGTIHGTWTFGRPMWMVEPLPSFNREVRVTGIGLETVSGEGTMQRTDTQLLVLPVGPYNGLTLSYRLDTAGGQLVPLGKSTVEPGTQSQYALVARVNAPSPGCHEARVLVTVKSGDTTRVFRTPWYVGLDTGISKGPDEHVCEPTTTASPTHS